LRLHLCMIWTPLTRVELKNLAVLLHGTIESFYKNKVFSLRVQKSRHLLSDWIITLRLSKTLYHTIYLRMYMSKKRSFQYTYLQDNLTVVKHVFCFVAFSPTVPMIPNFHHIKMSCWALSHSCTAHFCAWYSFRYNVIDAYSSIVPHTLINLFFNLGSQWRIAILPDTYHALISQGLNPKLRRKIHIACIMTERLKQFYIIFSSC
jgi:hypothetical protein